MKNIVLTIKGFFIGIANLIPGVSGGTIAITLGVYDKLINAISHIFSDFKNNIKTLLFIGIGIVLSILTLSKVMSYALSNFLFPTVIFFIGAIIGGIPMLSKKIKKFSISSLLVFVITFSLVILLTFLAGDNTVSFDNMGFLGYIKLFFVGIIASATMVVPGISGSALLMTIGYYEPIVNVIKDLTNFSNLFTNMSILVPFGIGVIFGIIAIAKIIEYLFKKYELKTYYAILGFVTSSVVSIIIQNFFMKEVLISSIDIIVGILLFIGGFLLAYKLGEK